MVLLLGKKTAEDTLQTAKLLMEHGLRDLINEADSLGNTPLHVLIARYALEERRYGYQDSHQPWNRWDMLHIVRYLLQVGYLKAHTICTNVLRSVHFRTTCPFKGFYLQTQQKTL